MLPLLCAAMMLLGLSIARSGAAMGSGSGVALEELAFGLQWPVLITHAPGDRDRVFVIERPGRIRIIQNGVLLDEPFLDITDQVVLVQETGLLGLTFHPDYAANGKFYLNFVRDSDPLTTVIAELTVSADPNQADPESLEVLMEFPAGTFHVAGWIGFGPDGYLYIATGENGNPALSQQLDDLRGKILRIDVNTDSGDLPYGIPPTNPFVGEGARDEIWALGLRNPYRCGFDRDTGDFWIADVGSGGAQRREELNIQPADSHGGLNYGWPCMEGTLCLDDAECDCASLELPAFEYSGHGCAVIGGLVYRGCAIPELEGRYLFADYCGNDLWLLDGEPGAYAINALLPAWGIMAIGDDSAGELYVCRVSNVFKLVPSVPIRPDPCEQDPPLPGDLNGDGLVNSADLVILLTQWGPCRVPGACPPDFNEDGRVNVLDLLVLLDFWH